MRLRENKWRHTAMSPHVKYFHDVIFDHFLFVIWNPTRSPGRGSLFQSATPTLPIFWESILFWIQLSNHISLINHISNDQPVKLSQLIFQIISRSATFWFIPVIKSVATNMCAFLGKIQGRSHWSQWSLASCHITRVLFLSYMGLYKRQWPWHRYRLHLGPVHCSVWPWPSNKEPYRPHANNGIKMIPRHPCR